MRARALGVKANLTPTPANAVNAGLLQRQCTCGQHTVAGAKCEACSDQAQAMRGRFDAAPQPSIAPPIVHDVLRSPGRPLDGDTRDFMEPRFAHDFSRVRVHTDASAAASARAVNASAYTVGRDIVFAENHYAPATAAGTRLLAHELAHTIQQNGAGAAASTPAPLNIGPRADTRENEADQSAAAILAGRSATVYSGSPFGLQRQPYKHDPDEDEKFLRLLSLHSRQSNRLFDQGPLSEGNLLGGGSKTTGGFLQNVGSSLGFGNVGKSNLLGTGGKSLTLTRKPGGDADEKTKAQQQAEVDRQLLSFYLQPRRSLLETGSREKKNVLGSSGDKIAHGPTLTSLARDVRSFFSHPAADEKWPSIEDFTHEFLSHNFWSDKRFSQKTKATKDAKPSGVAEKVEEQERTKMGLGYDSEGKFTSLIEIKDDTGIFKKIGGGDGTLTVKFGVDGRQDNIEVDLTLLEYKFKNIPDWMRRAKIYDTKFSVGLNPELGFSPTTVFGKQVVDTVSARVKWMLETKIIPKSPLTLFVGGKTGSTVSDDPMKKSSGLLSTVNPTIGAEWQPFKKVPQLKIGASGSLGKGWSAAWEGEITWSF